MSRTKISLQSGKTEFQFKRIGEFRGVRGGRGCAVAMATGPAESGAHAAAGVGGGGGGFCKGAIDARRPRRRSTHTHTHTARSNDNDEGSMDSALGQDARTQPPGSTHGWVSINNSRAQLRMERVGRRRRRRPQQQRAFSLSPLVAPPPLPQ